MPDSGAPEGSKPVKVASLMSTHWLRTKSSAVSVWMSVAVGTRDRVAIFPSGSPVEKVNDWAEARDAVRTNTVKVKVKVSAKSAARVTWPVDFLKCGVVIFFVFIFYEAGLLNC